MFGTTFPPAHVLEQMPEQMRVEAYRLAKEVGLPAPSGSLKATERGPYWPKGPDSEGKGK